MHFFQLIYWRVVTTYGVLPIAACNFRGSPLIMNDGNLAGSVGWMDPVEDHPSYIQYNERVLYKTVLYNICTYKLVAVLVLYVF